MDNEAINGLDVTSRHRVGWLCGPLLSRGPTSSLNLIVLFTSPLFRYNSANEHLIG